LQQLTDQDHSTVNTKEPKWYHTCFIEKNM